VRGSVKDRGEKTYLHRGIATRAFERHFDLADFVKVGGASIDNGLLTIDLQREIPEAMKPRKVAINSAQPKAGPAQIDQSAA
jgi:molecular chaperone IbpA